MDDLRTHHRRLYLVDRPYQLRFATRLFLVIFTVANITLLAAMAILLRNMYRPDLGFKSSDLVAALLGVVLTLIIELIISIPIVYYVGIRQSHHVVGPLRRMSKALEAIGQGDFSQRLTLRRGDVLEALAGTINQMAENLQKRFPRSSS